MKTKKEILKRTKPKLSFEALIAESKGPERERLNYANARWEFLRRNKEFTEAVNSDNHKAMDVYVSTALISFNDDVWKMGSMLTTKGVSKKILNPNYSFEDFVAMFSNDVNYQAKSLRALMLWIEAITPEYHGGINVMIKEWEPDGDVSFEILRPRNYDPDIYIPEEVRKTGILEITVDLKYKKKKLLSDFKTLIDMCKPHAPKGKRIRQSHNYDLYPLYLKVYDMRHKDKLTYKKIASRLIPNDFDTDSKAAEIW